MTETRIKRPDLPCLGMNSQQQGSRRRRRSRAGVVLLTLLAASGAAISQPSTTAIDAVISEQASVEAAARESQNQIAELDAAADVLLAEYRQVTAEAESLRGYSKQMEVQIQSQLAEMAEIEQQFGEIETTSREVIPLMQRMIETLDQFIALDLPFLTEERRNRVATLRDMMDRADVSVSEKYRRILEAYSIEMEYGRTIEAYRDELESVGGITTVEILRLGRVALLYQSLDGEKSGYWDAAAKSWTLDDSYQRGIRQGLRIAKQQTAPGLMVVPVAAPRGN